MSGGGSFWDKELWDLFGSLFGVWGLGLLVISSLFGGGSFRLLGIGVFFIDWGFGLVVFMDLFSFGLVVFRGFFSGRDLIEVEEFGLVIGEGLLDSWGFGFVIVGGLFNGFWLDIKDWGLVFDLVRFLILFMVRGLELVLLGSFLGSGGF